MDERQRRMVGHGAVVTTFGLLAGFGLLMKLIGGFEALPGYLLQFELPGTTGGWARMHSGGLMNGILVITGALLIWAMQIPERLAGQLYWMLVGTGYANTVFYWGGVLSPSRALTFGDNRLGESNIAGIIGLVPAFVFAFITTAAMIMIALHAFRSTR